MADPHRGYPAIHVAGTNGKTSTTRLAAAIIAAHGLTVGSFVSPHLQAVEERFSINGLAMTRDDFAAAMTDVVPFVELHDAQSEVGVTYFELTAALAFAHFAERAVGAAVVEVGLGGRLDATNVLHAQVAVLTGISLDHTEFLGHTQEAIAAEKVAILDPGGLLVTGPLPDAAVPPVAARVAETGAPWRRFGEDFRVAEATQAVGGWQCDVDGVYERYDDVYLPLHGRHQVDNLAVAVAAVEELFGRALDAEAVRAGVAGATSPGRLEVVHRHPMVVLDGAHNPDGTDKLAAALTQEFLPTRWSLVFGARSRRDPAELLAPLTGQIGRVYATAADDSGAVAPAAIAAGAVEAFGDDVVVVEAGTVAESVARAVADAGENGAVLVCGSLYVVGEARTALLGSMPRPDREEHRG